MTPFTAITREILERHNLPVSRSTLENRVTWLLHSAGLLDQVQHRVGRYRLDYAWPDIQVNLEADGPLHSAPMQAASDAHRDSYLREQGWLVFRVGGDGWILDEQVARVARVVELMRAQRYPSREGAEIHANWVLLRDKSRELIKTRNGAESLGRIEGDRDAP